MKPFYTVKDVRTEAENTKNLCAVDCFKIDPGYWNGSYYCEMPNIVYAGELDEIELSDDTPVYSIEVVSDLDYCKLQNISEEFADESNHVIFAIADND